jgi:transposase-like protein
MAKRARRSYSDKEREEIIQTALKEDLTAPQVQKRFGVKPVTWYSWRKKVGVISGRGRKPKRAMLLSAGGAQITPAMIRGGVQDKVREILPQVIREEVSRYLEAMFKKVPPRRRS